MLINQHQNSSAGSDQSLIAGVRPQDNSCNLMLEEEQEQRLQLERGTAPCISSGRTWDVEFLLPWLKSALETTCIVALAKQILGCVLMKSFISHLQPLSPCSCDFRCLSQPPQQSALQTPSGSVLCMTAALWISEFAFSLFCFYYF